MSTQLTGLQWYGTQGSQPASANNRDANAPYQVRLRD